jgi:hypothetical protein
MLFKTGVEAEIDEYAICVCEEKACILSESVCRAES